MPGNKGWGGPINQPQEEVKKEAPKPQWRIPDWFPDLDSSTQSKLKQFHSELVSFNRAINLVSPRTIIDADQLHFADSIIGGVKILGTDPSRQIFDVGSGNGFPGLVLGILAPHREVVLVDKDERRIEFLKHAISKLELPNVKVYLGQVEAFGPNSMETVVLRGFANISKTLLLLRSRIKKGGNIYHFKGRAWVREIAEIPTQICAYWDPLLLLEYNLPELNDSKFAVVQTKKVS